MSNKDDMKALFGLDAEQVLADILQNEICKELMLENFPEQYEDIKDSVKDGEWAMTWDKHIAQQMIDEIRREAERQLAEIGNAKSLNDLTEILAKYET